MLRAATLALAGCAALGVCMPTVVRGQNLTCGIHCGSGTFTSCNDSASLTGGVGTISCSASQGSCQGEAFCATLGSNLPATAFPLDIEELVMVAAGAAPISSGMPFDLRVYREVGTLAPGPQIGTTYNLSIPGSQTAAIRVDLTSGGLSPIRVPTSGPFRVCLTKQFDAGHNVCLDTNGSVAGRNWAFVAIASNPANPCGSIIIPPAWYPANQPPFPGLSGDFILRATVRPSQLSGVPGYADCVGGDAGIADGGGRDGGPADALDGGPGEVGPDGGPTEVGPDAGDPADGGPGPDDTGVPTDMGGVEDSGTSDPDAAVPTDAGGSAPDTGPTDAGPRDTGTLGPTPEITLISPRSGTSGAATSVLITGRGFASGLTARLGQITLVNLETSGGTTIRATVPPEIADGVYDLIVTNPDGQAAIAAEAFTVGLPAAPAEPDGCVCERPSGGSTQAPFPLALILVLAGLDSRRRRSRR